MATETTMTIEEVIGQRIQELRNQMDPPVSQAEIGRRLGDFLSKPWPRQSVSHAEGGNRAFTAVELAAFASVYAVPVADLVEPPPGVRVVFPSGLDWEPNVRTVSEGDLTEVVKGIDELERAAQYLRSQHEMTRTNLRMEEVILSHVDKAYTALHHALRPREDDES